VLAIVLSSSARRTHAKGLVAVSSHAKHAGHKMPTIVLVVTPDAEVATWAPSRSLGLGLSIIKRGLAAERAEVTDAAVASRRPSFPSWSGRAHGNGRTGCARRARRARAARQEHAGGVLQIVFARPGPGDGPRTCVDESEVQPPRAPGRAARARRSAATASPFGPLPCATADRMESAVSCSPPRSVNRARSRPSTSGLMMLRQVPSGRGWVSAAVATSASGSV